ncbi:MAG: aldehyde dehydrogenase family protein [Reyranellaceae bacterium]
MDGIHAFDPDLVPLPVDSFIDGQRAVGKGSETEVRRPSDGKVAARFAGADAELVDQAVAVAKKAFRSSDWARAEPRRRGAVLRRWAELVERHTEELAQLESLSSSRVIAETRVRDVTITAELIRFYGECADKLEGQVLATREDVFSLTLREPFGVVGAIAPWNVPMVLATAKFAPALAAGNAVVLKPSELTPFTALRLAQLAIEAGLPKGLFNVVVGYGPEAGSPLVRHPDIGCVSFTGSTATGEAVMVDAARNGLKPVSLELGGKSPQLVFADVPDIDAVAATIASGVARNAGQLCYCGSRLVVERSIADQLVEKVAALLWDAKPGPTWSLSTTLAPIISSRQVDRIADIVDRTRASGDEIVLGGEREQTNGGGAYWRPTIVRARPGSPVVNEEVFGPVLAVQTFDDLEEGLALADHPIYGLAGAVHTRDINKALMAARRIEAGMIWVNTYGRSLDIGSPFGGYKQSGFGKDFGVAALDKYLKGKSVWIQTQQGR